MARTGFRSGDRERLRKRFRAISPALRLAVEEALEANAAELTEAVRRNVPIDDGDLKASIRWRKGLPKAKRRDGTVREAGQDPDLSVRVIAGDEKAFYARLVEFGTAPSAAEAPRQNRNYRRTVVMTKGKAAHAGIPAQPFFFPTYRAWKRKLKARLSRAVGKAIKGV